MARLCQGLLIFHGSEMVTVFTPADHGGFPKGKPHKKENSVQTALRETQEETGITVDQLEVLPLVQLIEYNDRGNQSVAYTIARYTGTRSQILVCSDPEELAQVKWLPVAKVVIDQRFHSNRREIAQAGYKQFIGARGEDFIPADQWTPDTVQEVYQFHRS